MSAPARHPGKIGEVFAAFLTLGLTSFGGPVAHLGYFRQAFVVRRQWLSERDYADLVALCQFLPGPASSQVGFAIGLMRAGLAGAFAAFVAFTLPSVILLAAVAYGTQFLAGPYAAGLLHGLKIAAVAVVAQAAFQMARRLAVTPLQRLIAVASLAVMLNVASPFTQLALIAGAALISCLTALRPGSAQSSPPVPASPSGPWPVLSLALFALLLIALPLLVQFTGNGLVDMVSRFYRAGALVFGGGHVVLPLLETELVAPGLIDRDLFLAGYGAAQAVPGPLFSFAFYAGMMLKTAPFSLANGLIALLAIYLPAFLLVLGALPYWARFRQVRPVRAALDGANAAVVGLLVATLVGTAAPAAFRSYWDVALAVAALLALELDLPPWAVVIGCGAFAALLRLG